MLLAAGGKQKGSLAFNTKKHFSVHGSDFKSFPVLLDCMFVIASGMFGCRLTAVGCAFGDDKDPEESNEEPTVCLGACLVCLINVVYPNSLI